MNINLLNLSMTNIGLYIGLYLRSHKWLLTDVVQKEPKGICLCKQATNVEDSSRTIVTLIYSVLITCKHTIPPSYKKILAYRPHSSIPHKYIQSGPVLHQIGCESSLDGRNPMTQDAFFASASIAPASPADHDLESGAQSLSVQTVKEMSYIYQG